MPGPDCTRIRTWFWGDAEKMGVLVMALFPYELMHCADNIAQRHPEELEWLSKEDLQWIMGRGLNEYLGWN